MCLQVNLALCCKAMLPILYMGHVSVTLHEDDNGRPLTRLSRRLKNQRGGVSHLEVVGQRNIIAPGPPCEARGLIDLRCAQHAHMLASTVAGVSMCLPSPYQCLHSLHSGLESVSMLLCAGAVR